MVTGRDSQDVNDVIFFMVTGTDCQDDYDACDESPCDAYQTCTDLTPEQQGESDVGYMCTGCPDGFDVHPVDATRFDSNWDFANMTLKIDRVCVCVYSLTVWYCGRRN